MDRRTCGEIAALVVFAAVLLVVLFWARWQAADRDAARCVAVGANPVVMTDGRVECVK